MQAASGANAAAASGAAINAVQQALHSAEQAPSLSSGTTTNNSKMRVTPMLSWKQASGVGHAPPPPPPAGLPPLLSAGKWVLGAGAAAVVAVVAAGASAQHRAKRVESLQSVRGRHLSHQH